MNEPPAKRQRLSEDDLDTTDARIAGQNPVLTYPTTPTRRRSLSYASPTKSSLARSHPNVLAKSPGRNVIESRGKILRAELLSKRSTGVNTNDFAGPPTQMPWLPHPEYIEKSQAGMPAEITEDRHGFASAIASAFTNAPAKPQPEYELPQSNSRSPARSRQPQSAFSASRRRSRVDDVMPNNIIPKLVDRSESIPEPLKSQSAEPELPPTPVQLGISPAPDRPRGLFSSSSAGSRSGSGRRRRRIRDGTSTIISSPLKPRDQLKMLPPPSTDTPEPELGLAQEAPESDMEEEPAVAAPVPSQELEAKRAILSDLQTTRDQCRDQLSRLEGLTDKFENNNKVEIDEFTTEALLSEMNSTKPIVAPEISNADSLLYLNLFAPGNLTLTHTTVPRRIKSRPQMIQKLTLAAPLPWPADVLQLSFDVLIDTGEARIGSIIQSKPGHFYKHRALQVWIEKRLEHRLHRHDVAGLVWGTGQYFEACVQRAKTLKSLSQKYGQEVTYANELEPSDKLTPREAMVLCHYLDVSEITFAAGASMRQSEGTIARQLLLTHDLNLSWTGIIAHNVDISVTGVNAKAERGAKALFHKLLAHNDVVSAVDKVWMLLEFGPNNMNDSTLEKGHEHNRTLGQALSAN